MRSQMKNFLTDAQATELVEAIQLMDDTDNTPVDAAAWAHGYINGATGGLGFEFPMDAPHDYIVQWSSGYATGRSTIEVEGEEEQE